MECCRTRGFNIQCAALRITVMSYNKPEQFVGDLTRLTRCIKKKAFAFAGAFCLLTKVRMTGTAVRAEN